MECSHPAAECVSVSSFCATKNSCTLSSRILFAKRKGNYSLPAIIFSTFNLNIGAILWRGSGGEGGWAQELILQTEVYSGILVWKRWDSNLRPVLLLHHSPQPVDMEPEMSWELRFIVSIHINTGKICHASFVIPPAWICSRR